MRPKVILEAGPNTYLVRHIPKLLFEAGAYTTLVAPPEQAYRGSRYIDNWFTSSEDEKQRAEDIKALYDQDPSQSLIITTEFIFEYLVKQYPEIFSWLKPDFSQAFSSKTDFAEWAQAQDIAIPKSTTCGGLESAKQWVGKHGACMMKINHSGAGQGVRKVEDVADVENAWLELNKPSEFLMQQYVEGKVGVTELILIEGEARAWFSSFKARTLTSYGPSLCRQMITPSSMDSLVHSLAKASGFHGICGFDWIFNPETNELNLIEFHPRCPSGLGWGKHVGVDVPHAIADMLKNETGICDRPDDHVSESPLLCYFPDHLKYALKYNRSDLKHWLPWTSSVAWQNVPCHDPQVLAMMGINLIRK